MCENKDVKNESSLLFEIQGYTAGTSLPKFSSIHPYMTLIELTNNEEALRPKGEFATVCYDGKFKESPSLYNKLQNKKWNKKLL
jgi:hypothetical protein